MKRTALLVLATLTCLLAAAQMHKREMRGAWIATVSNIDWPSKQAIGNSELQQQEMIDLLDRLKAVGINTVIFQVRPTADALYPSELEPWSLWLTGKQGQDNDTHYDPLAFVLEEAHRRAIDVHVWINPYRVTNQFGVQDLASTHLYHQHPEWFWKYGKQWYFEPGLDQTREFLCRVVADLVRRYDIDAIHMDDYFYPYPIKGEKFPDAATFSKYPRDFDNIDDWRRNNVNLAIRDLHDTIHSIKPWVEFGISPFGIWRNKSNDARGSETSGLQNYDELYADILLWLEQGWIDYVVPQLYWEIGKRVADYQVLAPWWAEHCYSRNYYVGHSVSGLSNPRASEAWRTPNEICRQLALNNTISQVQGSVFFPATGLLRNAQGVCDSLRNNYYRYPALHPINCNQPTTIALQPTNPRLQLEGNAYTLSWDKVAATGAQQVSYYVVYAFPEFENTDFDNPKNIIALTADNTISLPIDPREYRICITAVNRYKQESLPCIVETHKISAGNTTVTNTGF